MEIVSETKHLGAYWVGIGLSVCVMLPIMTIFIGLVIDAIKERDSSSLVGSIAYLLVITMIGLFLAILIKDGPKIEYRAIVTDYNEVYENGYEVIRHEGDLVVLKKRR